jgi:ABC-type multidrug transport system fused ATPase/permease subunit
VCLGLVVVISMGYCRTQLFGALIRRDIAFFDKTDTGTLTSRLQADCQAMTKCVATNLNIAMRNLLQAIGG